METGLLNSAVALFGHFPDFPLPTGIATTTNRYGKHSIHWTSPADPQVDLHSENRIAYVEHIRTHLPSCKLSRI